MGNMLVEEISIIRYKKICNKSKKFLFLLFTIFFLFNLLSNSVAAQEVQIYSSQYTTWYSYSADFYNSKKIEVDSVIDILDRAIAQLKIDFGYSLNFPIIVKITEGSCCGAYASVTEIGFSSGNFDSSHKMCDSQFTALDWAKGVAVGEFVNAATGQLTENWPIDWWSNGVWYFPGMAVVQSLNEIGEISLANLWESEAASGCTDYKSHSLYNMFKGIKTNYGWQAYQNAFSAIRQDQINLGDIANNPSELRSSYVLAYLTMGTGTDGSELIADIESSGKVSYTISADTIAEIKNARDLIINAESQNKNVDTVWNVFRGGDYASVEGLLQECENCKQVRIEINTKSDWVGIDETDGEYSKIVSNTQSPSCGGSWYSTGFNQDNHLWDFAQSGGSCCGFNRKIIFTVEVEDIDDYVSILSGEGWGCGGGGSIDVFNEINEKIYSSTCILTGSNQPCPHTFQLSAPPPSCPTCPVSSNWAACTNNITSRTNYQCSADTNYECQPYIENQSCLICEEKYLNSYRCSGDNRQRKYQFSDCSTSWDNITDCRYGCDDGSCSSAPKKLQNTDSEVNEPLKAWNSILETNKTLELAKSQDKETEKAESMLQMASSKYDEGNYTIAEKYAESSVEYIKNKEIGLTISIISGIVIVIFFIVAVVIYFYVNNLNTKK